MNKRNECMVVFLDVAKVYDAVKHWCGKLIYKFKKMGIKGVALKLCEYFLTDRMKWNRIGQIVSHVGL